jgi:hypothetical protein
MAMKRPKKNDEKNRAQKAEIAALKSGFANSPSASSRYATAQDATRKANNGGKPPKKLTEAQKNKNKSLKTTLKSLRNSSSPSASTRLYTGIFPPKKKK